MNQLIEKLTGIGNLTVPNDTTWAHGHPVNSLRRPTNMRDAEGIIRGARASR